MKRVLIIAGLLVSGACAPQRGDAPERVLDPAQVDGRRAFAEVEHLLGIPNRDAGTAGAERAARHIMERLRAMGIAAEIEAFEDAVPGGTARFHNVVARIPGDEEGLVVLGSHFDTKAGMPAGFRGANDSGSSTGLLLELARVLQASPRLRCDLELVFFDGEECRRSYGPRDGLHGSRHYVRKLVASGRDADVEAVVILDMIGDRDLDVTFPRNISPHLLDMAFRAARELKVRDRFGLSRARIIDDHVPFRKAGMPAINFIDFHYGSKPGSNDYWHTAEDTLDKISPRSLETVGQVVLQVLALSITHK